MSDFEPKIVSFEGTLVVDAGLEAAFPLFSPDGERAWVPTWKPEILHPPSGAWRKGQVFRTQEEDGEALWLVSQLSRENHEVEYHRLQPKRHLTRVRVRCCPSGQQQTEVTVSYCHVGLSEAGNRELAAMSPDAHRQRLQKWSRWIRTHLAGDGFDATS